MSQSKFELHLSETEQKIDTWVCEVESVFKLPRHDVIILVKLVKPEIILRVSDELVLLCPDGQEITTIIKAFPMVKHSRGPGFSSISLPRNDQTKQIIEGTQVFMHRVLKAQSADEG